MGFGWSSEQIGKIDGWDSEFDSLTVEGPCQKPYPSFDLGIIQIYMCFSKTIKPGSELQRCLKTVLRPS